MGTDTNSATNSVAWAARRNGIGRPGQIRAGTELTARGEFSIVIAGLAATAGASSELGSLAAAYVLMTAAAGPILTRFRRPGEGLTVRVTLVLVLFRQREQLDAVSVGIVEIDAVIVPRATSHLDAL